MDKGIQSNGHVEPGISLRMGPVEQMDVDGPDYQTSHVNGTSTVKRKSRGSLSKGKTYKEPTSSEDDDDEPLVRISHSLKLVLSDFWTEQAS